jgi:hypothetical protein
VEPRVVGSNPIAHPIFFNQLREFPPWDFAQSLHNGVLEIPLVDSLYLPHTVRIVRVNLSCSHVALCLSTPIAASWDREVREGIDFFLSRRRLLPTQ